MKKINYIIFSLIVFLLLTSCTDDQCNAETESLLKTELFVLDGDLKDIDFLDSMSVFSPEWTDSIHYSEEGSKKILYLTLSSESDTSNFIITSSQATTQDTISIYYQRELLFISTECGFVTNYTIDTIIYSYNYIDSLQIINKNISTDNNGYIKIYF